MKAPRTAATGYRGRHSSGFTLIEMIIVVVILGILMSVVLPGYQESMRKGRRADAKAGLMDVANRQERFMLDRSTYTTDMKALGLSASTTDTIKSEEGHYNIKAAACASATIATCYLLTATPVTGGAQDGDTRCTSLILDSTGARTATGSANTECW